MGDRTEETKALLRHALLRREASAENDQLQDLFESLCKDIAALTAERDRLAAENAELRADLVVVGGAFSHATATLDRLREVLAKWMAFDAFNAYDAIGEIRAILYRQETTNDDR